MHDEHQNDTNGNIDKPAGIHEASQAEADKTNLSRIILAVGIGLLAVGILTSVFYPSPGTDKKLPSSQALESLRSSLSSYNQARNLGEPSFEATLIDIRLELYQAIASGGEASQSLPSASLLQYPVHKNDVAFRIEKDDPAIRPDYGKMRTTDYFLHGFIKAFKHKKYKSPNVWVVCLILKQNGKGQAGNVAVDMERVELKEVRELYDASFMGIHPEDDALRGPFSVTKKEQVALGDMGSGSGVIIPLAITNVFIPINEMDMESKSVVSNIAYIPVNISFLSGKSKERKTLPVEKIVSDPIIIN
ncbi:hypothetical protein [Methylomagnum ishizawai]|uniref:hypothetical protein n=1 Tax=Methylomagnum ishizawai TaxID=1760988 RepID=UPI001C321C92|nr:hypothetical protein [Methylomagnum ishizawai]BBL77513.1 hypothetical protein MishRS11D_46110 [Methylomagnum ishizawai]